MFRQPSPIQSHFCRRTPNLYLYVSLFISRRFKGGESPIGGSGFLGRVIFFGFGLGVECDIRGLTAGDADDLALIVKAPSQRPTPLVNPYLHVLLFTIENLGKRQNWISILQAKTEREPRFYLILISDTFGTHFAVDSRRCLSQENLPFNSKEQLFLHEIAKIKICIKILLWIEILK